MATVYFVDANVGQKSRVCGECGGKGCDRCGGRGRRYEITPPEPLPLALYRLLNEAGIEDIMGQDNRSLSLILSCVRGAEIAPWCVPPRQSKNTKQS